MPSRDERIVALAAFVPRFAVMLWAWGRFPATADGTYYHRLAGRLADGDGYTWSWPDGAVTYASHYPVGYPAALSVLYRVFGASENVAMLLAVLLGTLAALATFRLMLPWRRAALVAGLLVALHPGLVLYTPALMTEAITAYLLVIAAWGAVTLRRRPRWWGYPVLGLVFGACILVRPQCLLVAPVFGFLATRPRNGWARRVALALVVTLVGLATVAPWTYRNCRRMDRCALVSVNGGWNLLIGTQPEGKGAWSPLQVPAACTAVYDEAKKDTCFEQAARARISAEPGAWLRQVPAKLSATFDYCGAPGWYLHQANATAFGERAKLALGVGETLYERIVMLLALAACWPQRRGRRAWRRADWLSVALIGGAAITLFTRAGWIAVVLLLVLLALARPRWWRRPQLAFGLTFALLGATALVHAVFFGAGRYALLTFPFLCLLAAVGLGRMRRPEVKSP